MPSGRLSGGGQRCLTAIVQYADRGGVSMSQMKAITGYATRSVTTHVSSLRVAGYLASGWPLFPTDEGLAALGDYEPLPSGDELRAYWLRELPEGPRRVLELLVAARPHGLNNADLVERSDYALRSVTTHVSALKVRCVVYKASGRFHASEDLFG